MGKVSPRFGMHGAARLAFAAFAAALMAGCADSSRFMGDPLGNPFRSASNDVGRDLPSSRDLPSRDLPSRSLPSRDLAARDMAPPPPYRPVRSAAISSRPLPPVGEQRRVADYAAPAHANPRLASDYSAPRTERTASIAAPSGHGSWSSAGGMAIIAGTGDTAGVLANRYNVPTEALLHENGLSSASQIQPGTRLVIPVYNANGGGSSRVASAEPDARQPRDHSSRARLLSKHEPSRAEPDRTRIARAEPAREEAPEPRKPHGRELAMTKAERAKADRMAKLEQARAEQARVAQAKAEKAEQARVAQARIAQEKAEQLKTAQSRAPQSKTSGTRLAQQSRAEKLKAEKLAKAEEAQTQAAARKLAKAEAKKAAPVAVAKAAPAPEQKVAKLEEAPRKAAVDPTPTASLPPPAAADKVSANGNPEFRWPAHGRIIQGFKSGGNDGINIAVPEGTQVKAAESGVVAYAGNEIKGFGNLVLIRHPNGYVTAYANNSDIAVRRGEQVKRGQTIAKSGQSGNVASPQLHFELRKGSTPVDPTRYLAGL